MISIIIPCYNCEATIERTLQSVFNQSYLDWELILVNNNSTDATQDILNRYCADYPSKIKLFGETKPGAPAARNRGIREADGDWIQFLDADDEILKDKLSIQYALAQKNPDCAFISSPYTMEGMRSGVKFQVVRGLETQDLWLGLINSMLGITSANLWNKKDILSVGGWDENLAASQEYDLMFRIMIKNYNVGLDTSNNTIIHQTDGSISRVGDVRKTEEITKSRIGLRLRISEHLKLTNELSTERRQAIDVFIYSILVPAYRSIPKFVKQQIKMQSLDVPFKRRLKGEYFFFKMNIKRLLIKFKY
jgi:glycosyltransferase involved in cell wall biosynthesis